MVRYSIDIGNNAVRDEFLVPIPVLPVPGQCCINDPQAVKTRAGFNVLLLAFLIVASLSVDQENSKVDNVKVGQGSVKTGWEGPCKGHQEVTPVDDWSE
jgi:hypothetical protein